MAKRLREHSVSEDEAGDEHLQDVSTSGPLEQAESFVHTVASKYP